MKIRTTLLTCSCLLALAAPAAADEDSNFFFSTPSSSLDVRLSGQVNRAVMFADQGYDSDSRGDGSSQEFYHVDNRNSPTRFNIQGNYRLMQDWSAGAEFEVDFMSNSSLDVTPNQKSISAELRQRKMQVFIDGPYGKLSIGQGEGAAFGAGRADLSGTGVISFRHPGLIGGRLFFDDVKKSTQRNNNTQSVTPSTNNLNRTSIIGGIRDLNFEGRYDRLRIDSPRLGAAVLSASIGQKSRGTVEDDGSDFQQSTVAEIGMRAATRVFGGRAIARAGYSRANDREKDPDNSRFDPIVTTIGGSVSFLANNGFNISFAALNRSEELLTADKACNTTCQNRSELAKFRYIKLGYRPNNQHAFDIHFGETIGRNKNGDVGSVYGVGYVWSPIAAVDVYAGAKVHSFKRDPWSTGTGVTTYRPKYEDITIVTSGMRVKF